MEDEEKKQLMTAKRKKVKKIEDKVFTNDFFLCVCLISNELLLHNILIFSFSF